MWGESPTHCNACGKRRKACTGSSEAPAKGETAAKRGSRVAKEKARAVGKLPCERARVGLTLAAGRDAPGGL